MTLAARELSQALARQQLDDKLTTSVNAGNAGVGRVK